MTAPLGHAHFPGYLDLEAQRALATACLALGSADAGFYTPVVRGQYPMSVRMLCLGRHWNAVTYRYADCREDVDGLPVPPLPASFASIATGAAARAGFAFAPDICIVNWYDVSSRMGLHQDKDESPESIASAEDLLHAETRVGGPSRLRYHGVSKILAGSCPADLGFAGRLNLTFRQF